MAEASYFPNYFSVDDILATQERIPCKFLQNVPKLGNLRYKNIVLQFVAYSFRKIKSSYGRHRFKTRHSSRVTCVVGS